MRLKTTLICIITIFVLTGCNNSSSEGEDVDQSKDFSTSLDKNSYALGYDLGGNLAQSELEFDVDTLVKGLRDAIEGNDPLLGAQELQEVLDALQKEMMVRQMEQAEAQAEENVIKGHNFMEQYQQKEGVMQTESGMLYRIIDEGGGDSPGPSDQVTVHYTGKLIDGTVFDSSLERGQPATFPLNQVIPGWTEILQLMPQDSKWEVVIPPDLAYGQQQAGPHIGPGSTLVFEIELLEIYDSE